MTEKRNGPPKRPVPRTVENVNDDLSSHFTTSTVGGLWITADRLMDIEFPEMQWAVPGLLPEGTALVAGAPKIGKSTWALNLCVAVATGGKAFGTFDVEQGDVLYATLEDGGHRRVRERLDRHLHGEPAPARLHLTTEMKRLDEGGIDDLDAMLYTLPDARLVVVDTFQRVRPARSSRNRAQYAEDYEAASPLTELAAQYNVTVAVIHHTREMAALDWLDSPSGSRGITAVVDTILVAERGRGSADVVMHTTGRDLPETDHAFNIDFETFTWNHIGDAATAQLTPDRRAVIDTLKANGPSTPTQIANATGLNYDSVKHLVKRMVNDGLIKNRGDGTYGPIGKGSTW